MEAQHIPQSSGNRRTDIVLVVFLGIIAFFLFTEHRVHLLGILPFLLLLACPILHWWMHGRHGGQGGDEGGGGFKGGRK